MYLILVTGIYVLTSNTTLVRHCRKLIIINKDYRVIRQIIISKDTLVVALFYFSTKDFNAYSFFVRTYRTCYLLIYCKNKWRWYKFNFVLLSYTNVCMNSYKKQEIINKTKSRTFTYVKCFFSSKDINAFCFWKQVKKYEYII